MLKTPFCLKLGTRQNCLVTASKQMVKQEKKKQMYKDGEKGNKMSVFIKAKRAYEVYGCISGMLRFLDSQVQLTWKIQEFEG